MAIDPGVMTGYAYGEIHFGKLIYYAKQAVFDVDDLWRWIDDFKPRHLICEDFEFRGGARKGLNLFPVQLIGVVRLYSLIGDTQCAAYLQKASYGKQYYTDNMLKQNNLYKRGVPHGMDASRHLLQWFTFGAGFQFNNGSQEFAEMINSS